MLELMLDPATTELIWTLTVSTLLVTSTGLTIWLMPWSDQEILAVHRTVTSAAKSAAGRLPAPLTNPLTTTAVIPQESARRRSRPLASA